MCDWRWNRISVMDFFVISISVSSASKQEQQGCVVSPLLFVHMHWINLKSDMNCLDFSWFPVALMRFFPNTMNKNPPFKSQRKGISRCFQRLCKWIQHLHIPLVCICMFPMWKYVCTHEKRAKKTHIHSSKISIRSCQSEQKAASPHKKPAPF